MIPSRVLLAAGVVLGIGTLFRFASPSIGAAEPAAIQPAVAKPAEEKAVTMTPADHLRRAAEHLEAAGEVSLAQHVRQLASRPDRLPGNAAAPNYPRNAASPLYGGLPPISPPARLPVSPPHWTLQSELPQELDDGQLRWVTPARNRVEAREVRATPAPQRDPI